MHFFKKQSLSFIVVLTILLSFCQPKSDAVLTSSDTEILDGFLKDVYETYPLPGIAVGIVTEDESYVKFLGFGELGKQTPLSDTMMFFMGEASELLVTTAMLKLEAMGLLSLEDKVVTHLPYFKMQGNYDQIKIHHLLTHTSGIPHFNAAWDMPSYESGALEATTRSIIYQDLAFVPGSKRMRSPYNFDIAADILAKVSKTSFEEVIKENVIDPLKMGRTTYAFSTLSQSQYAQPYKIKDWLKYNFTLSEPYPYTRENAGSYGLHATIPDMIQWMKMALEIGAKQSLLPNGSLHKLTEKYYKVGEGVYKGYGWEIINDTVYNSQWNISGFSGDLTLFPEKKIGIIVVANTSGDFNPTIISEIIANFLNGGTLEKLKSPAHIEMGRKLANGQNIEAVMAWCDSLMTLKDSPYSLSPSIVSQLGVNLLHRVDRKEDALTIFRYCVNKYPQSVEAHLNLSECLLAMGLLKEAEEHFEIALALNPALNTPYANFIREQITIAQENETPA